MNEQIDTQLIMMVAQVPFQTPDMNQFCKLIPIAYVDGVRPPPESFPNDGEIWWMLTAHTSHLAEPGRLVVGEIEPSVRYETEKPDSSRYQVIRESVQDLNLSHGLEVINVGSDEIESIGDVVVSGYRFAADIPPTSVVMLYWRLKYYGPFNVTSFSAGELNPVGEFSCTPAHTNGMTVYEIDQSNFSAATKDHRISVQDTVSLTDHNRRRSHDLVEIRHELISAEGYERILAGNPRRLLLEPIERKLTRFAKECLTRSKRQQLSSLLSELEITGREMEDAQGLLEAIERTRVTTDKQEATLVTVAEALLKSGLLGPDRIAKAEQAFAEKYVEEKTAELQAKAEESLAKKRGELRAIDENLNYMRANLQKEKAQRRAELEQKLAAEREFADQKLAVERQALAVEKNQFSEQKMELERQQGLLQQNLEKVTAELREAGDDVVNRFLTIAPFLGGLGSAGRVATAQPQSQEENSVKTVVPLFDIPKFVTNAPAVDGELKEDVFFERFRAVVDDSGFSFRPIDLQRFHLSVKCGDLTVLGGPSGTGKSSLPALYTQALLGDELQNGRPSCMMVNVNPSWMDARDLLGHMNSLDSRFYPAESGLFQYLVFAQKEHEARGTNSALYMTCLDEMNLSQVEHYFSDFMMVLERHGSARKIRCFSSETVGSQCRFRENGVVALSPALRFVGTVNFDETTRLLSDRFLDRVNLIRLTSAALPGVAGAGGALAVGSGRMVTLADFEAWRTDSALPAELGLLLDQIRPLLSQMGCPISPRTYRAICRFVGSASPIMSQEKAFDVQVAQRIIPKIRSLISERQLKGLDALLLLLNQSNLCAFEESIPMIDEIRQTVGGRNWELDV